MRNNASRNGGHGGYEDYTEFSSKVESPIRFGARDQRAYTSFALEQEIEARPIVKAIDNGEAPMPNNGYPITDTYSFDETQEEIGSSSDSMGEYVTSEYAEEHLDTDGTSIQQIEEEPNTFESLPRFSRRSVFNNYGSVPMNETPAYLSADDGGIVSHEVGDEDAEIEHGEIIIPSFANSRLMNIVNSHQPMIDDHLGTVPFIAQTFATDLSKIDASKIDASKIDASKISTSINKESTTSPTTSKTASTSIVKSSVPTTIAPTLKDIDLVSVIKNLKYNLLSVDTSRLVKDIRDRTSEGGVVVPANKSTEDFLTGLNTRGDTDPLYIVRSSLFNTYNENYVEIFGVQLKSSINLINMINKTKTISRNSENFQFFINLIADMYNVLVSFCQGVTNIINNDLIPKMRDTGLKDFNSLNEFKSSNSQLESILNDKITGLYRDSISNEDIINIIVSYPDMLKKVYAIFIGNDNTNRLGLPRFNTIQIVEEVDGQLPEYVDIGNGLVLETETNFVLDETDSVIGRLIGEGDSASIQPLQPITIDDEIYYATVDDNGQVLVFDDSNQLADQETIDAVIQALQEQNVQEQDNKIIDNDLPTEVGNGEELFGGGSKEGMPSWVLPAVFIGLVGGGFYLYNRNKNK